MHLGDINFACAFICTKDMLIKYLHSLFNNTKQDINLIMLKIIRKDVGFSISGLAVRHIYNQQKKKGMIDSLQASSPKDIWEKTLSNEWGHLAQGNYFGITTNDSIDFINFTKVPNDRDKAYASFVCNHRPLKSESWRVCIVVGGDRLSYSSDTGSLVASLLETKILIDRKSTRLNSSHRT